MRRKKSRAKRRVVRSRKADAVEVEVKGPGPSKIVMEADEAGNKREKNIDREFDCFKEEFEEVENVVSAVMEMDTVIQENQIKNSDSVVENKSNFSDGNIGQNLSGQKSVEGEPSPARIKVMKLHGDIDDSYSNKEENNGEKEKESRDDREQSEDIEVCDVKQVPRVFNYSCLTERKKEKQMEIHVGGLHKDTVEQDLVEIFGKFGEVQIVRIVRHPTTNKSKGFAFIQYATVEQAKKVLSNLKDGIEVRGKRAKLSISHDRDILYLGNICKTWAKENVLLKLKGYGIEDIDEIQVPNDPKNDGKIKGFAFLRFKTCSDAKAAFHRLRKPDAVFGNSRGAKVAFARSPMHPRKEVRLQVKTVYIQGIPKSWDVQKLKEICEQYGVTKRVKISRNFGYRGKDFGFISFTTRESAVTCVGGMNNLQFGGNVKVKADIARPLVGGRLQKSCGGLKLIKRLRSTGWRKMKGYARFEGAVKQSNIEAQTFISKSKIRGTEEKAVTVAHKNNQDPLNSKHGVEGEKNVQQSISPAAHGARAGLSAKPKKTNDRRKNRKRQRDRMYTKRPSKKLECSSQGRPSHSSRNLKSRSHLRKGPSKGAYSIAYRMPYKEAYAASTSGYPGSGYGAISGSKRLSSDLEPHAGFVQHVKPKDQYHAAYDTTAFRHQRQTYAGHLNLDSQYERQPPAKYFKPAIWKDALPHARYHEPAFEKQSFNVDDYPGRRTGKYNGPGNQGPVHGAGSAFSLPCVPNYMTSYTRYEHAGQW